MEFQGFQNILPSFLIFAVIAGILFISWYTYHKKPTLPNTVRWALTGLRAFTLCLIFLLFLNPYFYSSEEVTIEPKLAVFLDNSESVNISRGDYKGQVSYEKVLEDLNLDNNRFFVPEYFTFGMETENQVPDSLNFGAPRTNLSRVADSFLELEDDVRAALLISDGIITYGKDPTFAVTNSSIPLFTIGVGDTSQVKDVAISNVLTNSTGYTNTSHFIEASVNQTGFKGRTAVISLMQGNEVVQQKNISFDADRQVLNISFELPLEEPGLKQYYLRVNPLEQEWTTDNNRQAFSINVLDSQTRILHIAFQMHPDVKTLRTILSEDANNELFTLTWLGNNRFVEEMPETGDFNLVVIHGLPSQPSNINLPFQLDNTPSVFLSLGPNRRNIPDFISDRLIIENISPDAVPVQLNPLLTEDEQPIMELPTVGYSNLPPLQASLRSTNRQAGALNLFSSTVEGANTGSPVISILEQGNIRKAHINAWGWYRVYLANNPVQRNFVTDLITNIISWTSSDPDNRLLQVAPAQQSFTTGETPKLNGSLRNESGSPEEDAIVEVQVSSGEENNRTFNMSNMGNGTYRLNLPNLSEGVYSYTATARKGNRTIDSESGEFLVSNSNTELTNTTRNDALLRALAENTGGSFVTYTNAGQIMDSLLTAGFNENQTEIKESYFFPLRSIYWFIVVVILLAAEWLIRKYYSLP